MPDARTTAAAAPILFFDGTCGFCDATVQFILRYDRRGTLRFAHLQGNSARALHDRHPWLAQVDSLVWYEHGAPELVLVRSEAALRVARYLGFPWSLALLSRVMPRAWRDRLYDVVARHRRRVRPLAPACAIPPAAVRARFLD